MRRIKKRSRLSQVVRVLIGAQQYRLPTRESNEVIIDVIAEESDRTKRAPTVPYGSDPPPTGSEGGSERGS